MNTQSTATCRVGAAQPNFQTLPGRRFKHSGGQLLRKKRLRKKREASTQLMLAALYGNRKALHRTRKHWMPSKFTRVAVLGNRMEFRMHFADFARIEQQCCEYFTRIDKQTGIPAGVLCHP